MLPDNLHNMELHCTLPDEDDNDDVPQQGAVLYVTPPNISYIGSRYIYYVYL